MSLQFGAHGGEVHGLGDELQVIWDLSESRPRDREQRKRSTVQMCCPMKTEFILVVIKLNQPLTDSPAQRRFWLCPFLATGLKWTAEESVQGSASNQEQPAEFLPGET